MADYDAFLSYFRNEHDEEYTRWIDQFCKNLTARIRLHTPTGNPFRLFHDRRDIKVTPVEWEQQIKHALTDVKLLLVILTRPYLRRNYCRKEVEWFLQFNEAPLGQLQQIADTQYGDSTPWIIPVEYTADPDLAADTVSDDKVREAIRKQQRKDWSELKYKDFACEEVRRAVDALAQEIAETMVLLDPEEKRGDQSSRMAQRLISETTQETTTMNRLSQARMSPQQSEPRRRQTRAKKTVSLFSLKDAPENVHYLARVPGSILFHEFEPELRTAVADARRNLPVVELPGFASEPLRLGVEGRLQVLLIGIRAGVRSEALSNFDNAYDDLLSSLAVPGVEITKMVCANIADVVRTLERRPRHVVHFFAVSSSGGPPGKGWLEFPASGGRRNFITTVELLGLCPQLRVVNLTNLGLSRKRHELYGVADVSQSLFNQGVSAVGVSYRPPTPRFDEILRFWRLFMAGLNIGRSSAEAAIEARLDALGEAMQTEWAPVVFTNRNAPQPFQL